MEKGFEGELMGREVGRHFETLLDLGVYRPPSTTLSPQSPLPSLYTVLRSSYILIGLIRSLLELQNRSNDKDPDLHGVVSSLSLQQVGSRSQKKGYRSNITEQRENPEDKRDGT